MTIQPKAHNERRILLILALITGLPPLSIDMYLPALPEMARVLQASDALLQLTLTAFLAGFAVGPLILGPLSDAIGRRKVILSGIAIFLLASLLCVTAQSAQELIVYRVIQALSGGSAAVLARSVASDLYSGDYLARMLSLLIMIMGFAPMVAPLLGGQLLLYWGWQSIFLLLAIVALFAFITVLWGLPETLPVERRQTVHVISVWRAYKEILTSLPAMGFALSSGFVSAAMFAYLAATPFVYIDYFGLNPQYYGLFFAANIAIAIFTSMLNARYVVRLGYRRLLAIGMVLFMLMAIVVFIASVTEVAGLWGIAVALFMLISVMPFIGPNATAGVFKIFAHRGGTASALVAASRFLAGMVATLLVSFLHDGTAWALGIVVVGCAALAALATLVALKTSQS